MPTEQHSYNVKSQIIYLNEKSKLSFILLQINAFVKIIIKCNAWLMRNWYKYCINILILYLQSEHWSDAESCSNSSKKEDKKEFHPISYFWYTFTLKGKTLIILFGSVRCKIELCDKYTMSSNIRLESHSCSVYHNSLLHQMLSIISSNTKIICKRKKKKIKTPSFLNFDLAKYLKNT